MGNADDRARPSIFDPLPEDEWGDPVDDDPGDVMPAAIDVVDLPGSEDRQEA